MILKGILKRDSIKRNISDNQQSKKVTFILGDNTNEKTKRTRKLRIRHRKKNAKAKHLKILYSNANGITGKMQSLKSALLEHNSSIALIAETKLEGQSHPFLENYKWIPHGRPNGKGGGVAILYSRDIENNIKPVDKLEESNIEVKWTKIKSGERSTYIGVYYGPQEKAPREEVQREYDTLKTHINRLKQSGDVILAGDFNAKLSIKIDAKGINQQQSRNGEMLAELLEDTDSEAINAKEQYCEWTRENRKNPNEKSIIDYIIVTKSTISKIKDLRVDTEGTHRLKGKEQSDHNAILIESDTRVQNQTSRIKVWKRGTTTDWKDFNRAINTEIANNPPATYPSLHQIIKRSLKKHIGQVTIRVYLYLIIKSTVNYTHKYLKGQNRSG